MAFPWKPVLFMCVLCIIAVPMSCQKVNNANSGNNPSPAAAWPSPATTCNYSAGSYCSAANSCIAGNPCNVAITVDLTHSTTTIALNGTTLTGEQIACVPQNTVVTWSISPANTNYLADFGNATPFTDAAHSAKTYVTGDSTAATSTTVGSFNQCYKYNIKVCPSVTSGTGGTIACQQIDPKVIVGGGYQLTKP